MKPKFNIGDTVWIARAGPMEKSVECPACYGQRALTVIMGNGEQVSIDCSLCSVGYEPSKGVIKTYEFQAIAEPVRIERVELTNRGFQFNHHDEVFATKEDALKRAEELKIEHLKEEENRLKNLKEYESRTWSWNATYHRRELKRAQEQVIYHTAKLNVAKVKAKENEN